MPCYAPRLAAVSGRVAKAFLTMCPICHLNLVSRQGEISDDPELPIFQATQLMALAFGHE